MAETVDKNRTTVPSSVGSESTRFNLIYLLVVVFAVRIVWEFVAFHKNAATPLLATMRASLGWNNEDLIGAADSVNANSMNSSLLPAAANNNDSISSSSSSSSTTQKTTVAYAVTVTKFSSGKSTDKNTLFDRAAILHQSIKSAMKLSSRYDYHIYAFVHPDAIEVKPLLESLGYRVQIRDTPFNITHIQNQNLIDAQGNGCCGEKEYLKLYSYLLLDYPVVVHVDMDYLVLKPMDDIFDIMTDSSYDRSKFQHSSMWTDMQKYNGSIDFMYTRDYNMVNPPRRQPHQIGVQGGFLVIRPSKEDFEKFVSVILSGGDFAQGSGWGGDELKFGGYYGAGTIQGLASYYYSHLEPNRDIELNRCYYNTMVDEPIHYNKKGNTSMCRTLEPDLKCQDCRETKLEDIYSVHFTVCGKPEWCQLQFEDRPLCRDLLIEWHKVRTSLELEWAERYPAYDPDVPIVGNGTDDKTEMMRKFGGHCVPFVKGKKVETKYSPMVFPLIDSETEMLI